MTVPYEDLRDDLGVSTADFPDAKLDRLWARLEAASDENKRFQAAKALMALQMRNSAAKLYDRRTGATGDQLSQVWDHWNKIYQEYKPILDDVLPSKPQQTARSTAVGPAVEREEPWDGRY
jgi:hypothetical protein